MRKVQYGAQTISYAVLEQNDLGAHYISVEKSEGVILKGKPLPPESADKMILKKARWILDKLAVVGELTADEIVTGSRIQYLGRNYYVEVLMDPSVKQVTIEFNHSKFIIRLQNETISQVDIQAALELFYKAKAIAKITHRVIRQATSTKLQYKSLSFRKMEKRWGSCSKTNGIVINIAAVKLPFTLIDYLIVHELTHIRVKNHSRAFYAELSRHLSNWQELDQRIKMIRQ